MTEEEIKQAKKELNELTLTLAYWFKQQEQAKRIIASMYEPRGKEHGRVIQS